ncbi:hypothetical protein A2U01_0089292, partial [Trifolium medium]|nr:hypothetical protein [Trifolium medium]
MSSGSCASHRACGAARHGIRITRYVL